MAIDRHVRDQGERRSGSYLTACPPAQNRSSPWNLPNGLTVLRLLLVPLMGWLLLRDGGETMPRGSVRS